MRISDGSSDVCSSDLATGVVHDFAVNRGELQGPASWGNHGGLERPVAVRFDPAGTALSVVDFGVLPSDERGNYPRPGTGAVWPLTRTGTARCSAPQTSRRSRWPCPPFTRPEARRYGER